MNKNTFVLCKIIASYSCSNDRNVIHNRPTCLNYDHIKRKSYKIKPTHYGFDAITKFYAMMWT